MKRARVKKQRHQQAKTKSIYRMRMHMETVQNNTGRRMLQPKVSTEEKTFQYDINLVGPFDRGTQYRTDGEIVVERCKRGSRKELEKKRIKVKTRGVPNKHLRLASNLVSEMQTNDTDETGDCIQETSTDSTRNSKGDCEYSIDDFDSDRIAHVSHFMNFTDNLIEYTEDKRHLTDLPCQVILGKKNDCDLLETKYGSRTNKRCQKTKTKKKRQRLNKHTAIQFGLNANNCADDLDFCSSDDETENCTPTISHSLQPLPEDYLSPNISFSSRPVLDYTHEVVV